MPETNLKPVEWFKRDDGKTRLFGAVGNISQQHALFDRRLNPVCSHRIH
jgi:hypothetical protein